MRSRTEPQRNRKAPGRAVPEIAPQQSREQQQQSHASGAQRKFGGSKRHPISPDGV
jgi:hypothetical protein